jgi:hypothetical protein
MLKFRVGKKNGFFKKSTHPRVFWVGKWVGKWVFQGSSEMTKNFKNLPFYLENNSVSIIRIRLQKVTKCFGL